jgi:hypothetical protein
MFTLQAGRLELQNRARAAEKPARCSAFRRAAPRVPYLLDAREDARKQGLVKGPTCNDNVVPHTWRRECYDLQLTNRLPRSHDNTIRVLGVACSAIGLLGRCSICPRTWFLRDI